MKSNLFNKILHLLTDDEKLEFAIHCDKATGDADIVARLEEELAALKLELMKSRHEDESRKQLSKDIIQLEQILNGDKPKEESVD